MRCTVSDLFPLLAKTETGKRKVWQTDGKRTFCCELIPSYFIWEKNTRHNDYNAYNTYIHCKHVTLLKKGE